MDQWYKVVWSDEYKFNLFGSDDRVYIRRRAGEDYLPDCVQSTVKFGGGSVMVWGCITSDGVGPLTTVDGRMKAKDYIDLLEQTLVSFMTTMGPDYVFQHCYVNISLHKYKLGYVKRGSTAFKVPKDGCGVPSAARALLGPEGLLMR